MIQTEIPVYLNGKSVFLDVQYGKEKFIVCPYNSSFLIQKLIIEKSIL
jgi:hypothetical protein